MDNYSSLKTCGTCIAFGKSSCAHPNTKIDCIACMKYQEAYYTLSATSQTTEISKPIMKEEKRLKHTLVSVYKINEQHVVANTIEDAIKLYKDAYEWETVKTVELIEECAWIKSDKDDEES